MFYLWLKTMLPENPAVARITTQAGLAALSAFAFSLVFGRLLIRLFRRRGVIEDVAKPDSATLDRLHSVKRGTPTMGGLMILAATLASTLLWANVRDGLVLLGLGTLLGLGALGFADDYLKLTRRPRRGLRARTKLAGQLMVGLVVGVLLWRGTHTAPADGHVLSSLVEGGVRLGPWFAVLAALAIAIMSNGVNLTDGVDGLAGGCVALAMLALAALAGVMCHAALSVTLGLGHMPEARGLAVLCAAVGGATLGFLWYNGHPAQIFMGDTGSLALGGLLGFVAVALRQEMLVLLLGCVFVVELLSVVLQVACFKATGRRLFRCSPIHHHFEFAGWPETKVTVRFWIVMVVALVCTVALFRVS